MKKKYNLQLKRILLPLIALRLMASQAQSQDTTASPRFVHGSYYTCAWNTTITLGDFNDWVGHASPAGFDLGGRYFIKAGLVAGFNIGWQRVSQSYTNETFYGSAGQAITATNYRFTWMIPFQGVIAYHLIPDKIISPYLGIGIGGDYMEHHLLVQEYDIYETRWGLSLIPEIGALVKFGKSSRWAALVAFNYKWTTNGIGLYIDRSSKNMQMLNLKFGLAFKMR
ncbi:MAG: hypothetical protein Q8M08_02755 [Bacteroidales bacterium]|nr:hypothetical protein [Bacteroidales bacterium]